MHRHWELFCLSSALLVASSVGENKPGSARSASESLATPLICGIVRTYWGHGDGGSSELRDLITSLQAQEFTQ